MSNLALQQEAKTYFSRELLVWYDEHKRDLPWRRSRNPYHIWISEIMLQQTRVDTVIPYFTRFIEKFPTVEALATAPEEEVLKSWEGLGYYSRARNLQAAAQQVVERHEGIVPNTPEEISALKGIGPYTAGAVLSIAYGVPVPAVDGNVMRVLSRYFCLEDDIAKGPTRVKMEVLAKELIPRGRASDFNQALMELGAMVCTPKSPGCLTCPVMKHCEGRMNGMELILPIKTKSKPPRPEHRLLALVEGTGERAGQVLIRQRPATGLLARMWELPHILADDSKKAGAGADLPDTDAMKRLTYGIHNEGVDIQPLEPWITEEHTFSHIHWTMRVFRCREAGVSATGQQSEPTVSYTSSATQPLEASQGALKEIDPLEYEQATLELKLSGSTPSSLQKIQKQLHLDDTLAVEQQEAVAEHPEVYEAVPSTLVGEAFAYDYRWITADDMKNYAFPNLFLKILQQHFAQ